LLLDHAPSHLQNLGALKACIPVEVVFLLTNTTSIIQPMNQGIIVTFKAYYIRCTFSHFIDAADNQQVLIKEIWISYNIMNAINDTEEAWKKISQHCLNAVWKKVWPDVVEESELKNDPVWNEFVNMA
jgi:hypothetical protein